MAKNGMSKQRQRRITLIGISGVLVVWLGALALLFAQPGSPSGNQLLPTMASPSQQVDTAPDAAPVVGNMNPTILPTSAPVDPPLLDNAPETELISAPSDPIPSQTDDLFANPITLTIPSEPVPNTLVLRFNAEMSDQERLDYINSLGGTVIQEILALNTVVITVPEGSAASIQSALPAGVTNEPDYYVGALFAPNDALAAGQWGLTTVRAPEAWDLLPAPAQSVTVAVVDSGICAAHPDLQGRIAPNGWDFVQTDNTPQDDYGHGCAVSGIISANSNNGLGIAGVAPNTTVLPLRVLDGSGIGRYSNVAAAIVYAVDNGADVINLSLGGPNPSTILQEAVEYAEAHGVAVIAAAGNAGVEQVYYPAAYPSAVAVGSVDQNLERSVFSNYGAGIDLYAPGNSIMTTRLDGSFQAVSGTSAAAPFVTGVWALREAMGKDLVINGGVVSALYEGDIPVPSEEEPDPLCLMSTMQGAEQAYFDLVSRSAAEPGSVSAEQLASARNLYLTLGGQCANVLYSDTMTIDGGGISPFGGDIEPLFQVFGTKWGGQSPFNVGQPPATPGGAISFSFMPNNVSLAAKEAANGGGTNAFITSINDLPGNTTCNLQDRVRQAFQAWGTVANIQFTEVQEAGIVPFGQVGQVGDMRIGAQYIDGMRGELGHAYFPPPDPEIPTSTRAGDIFLDRSEIWGCAPGEIINADGSRVRVIDIGLVMLHELGHALGMQHERAPGLVALMNPTYNPGLISDTNGGLLPLENGLQGDDRAGARAIYGALGVGAPAAAPVLDPNDSTPTFTWTDTTVGGSSSFEIEIYAINAAGGPGELVFTGTTTGGSPTSPNKSFTVPNTLPSQPYQWRVRAFDLDANGVGSFGDWSPFQTFTITVGVASLREPTQGQVLNTGLVTFTWSPVIGGDAFLLQIDTNTGFTAPQEFSVTGTSFTLPTPLDDGTYYWRVQTATSGQFSQVNMFRVDANVQLVNLGPGAPNASPADGQVFTNNTNIALTWDALPGVTEYQLQLDTSENFVGLLFLDKLFLDKLFLDKLFLDKLFLDKLFLDKLFLDKLFLDKLFLDKLFLDKLFLDKLFLDKLFLDKLFLDKLFLDKLFLDKLFLDKLFLDKLFLDKLFLDKIQAASGETVITQMFDSLPMSEGVHYWRVRPRLADGSFGPWSAMRSFEVRTQPVKVVINEINLNDPSWIEFHNTGTQTANMSGWQFFAYGPDGETDLLYSFPSGFTLPAGGYVVLYEGQGTNTDKALFTGGSQIDWPLVAQTTGLIIDESSALAGLGTVVPLPLQAAPVVEVEAESEPVTLGEDSAASPSMIIGLDGPIYLSPDGLPIVSPEQVQSLAIQTTADLTGDETEEDGSVTAQEAFVIAIGDTVSDGVPGAGAGNIEVAGSNDTYTFEGTAGQILYFDLISTSGFGLSQELRSPTNVLIFSGLVGSGFDGGRHSLTETGTYTLTYDGSGDQVGTYSFRILPVTDQTFPINIDDTVSDGVPGTGAGNIESPGNIDYYTFEGTAGQILYFDAIMTTNGAALRQELRSPTNVVIFSGLIGSNNDPGRRILTETGTYTLNYDGNSDYVGTYSFKVWGVTDHTFPININDTISDGVPGTGAGNLETPGAQDNYTFTGAAGDIVYFDAISGASQLNWRLFDPEDDALANSLLFNDERVVLTEAGTYRINVYGDENGFGSYSFKLWGVTDHILPISVGDTISDGIPGTGAGNLETPGAQDNYTFTGAAGDIVYFDAISGASQLNWRLFDPEDDALANSLLFNDERVVLTEAGTYRVNIYSDDNDTGTYSFKLWGVTDHTFPVNVGDTISDGVPGAGAGNIETPGAEDNYIFTVAAGDIVYLDAISATDSGTNWRLYSPGGSAIATNLSFIDLGRVVLAQAGTYRINVFPDDNDVGTYSFRLWSAADSPFNTEIDEMVASDVPSAGAGRIETPGARDVYSFSASAGQQVFFDVAFISPGSSLRWQLRNPSDTQVFDVAFGDVAPQALVAGTYTLIVYGAGNSTGTYSFRLSTPGSTDFTIGIGSTVSNGVPAAGAGNLNPAGNIDVYLFGGAAGQNINFDVLAGSAANIHWRLEDPDSNQLFNTSFADQNNVALPLTGTYTLRVQASAGNPNFTGTYSFQVILSSDTPQAGPTLTVNTTDMTDDGMCGVSNCTLIEAIDAANDLPGTNTINLGAGETYLLTAVHNTDLDSSPTGLPIVISDIRLNGNNSTIVRDSGAPKFRIFGIATGGALLSIDGTTVAGGWAENSDGGAVYNDGGQFIVLAADFFNNRADSVGGAIYNNGNATISIADIDSNIAGFNGGGIYNDGALEIYSTTLENNDGGSNGGGIYNAGTLILQDSTLVDNVADLNGGGLFNNSDAEISNSTFVANVAGVGGAIHDEGGVTISFVTITENVGGGIYTDVVVNAKNSIITGHGPDLDCSGDVNDQGVNFSEDGQCTGFLDGTPAQLNLGPLAENGGHVRTIELGTGSIAIDAATDCTTFFDEPVPSDPRGVTRPQGAACDVGAYELFVDTAQAGPDFEVNTTIMGDDGVCSVSNCTLIEAINAANADGVSSVITLNSDETYTLTEVNNTGANGPNGLPVISSNIALDANGSTIQRLDDIGVPEFRIFEVAASSTLALNSVEISGGLLSSDSGGAIYSAGTLFLNYSNFHSNSAASGDGGAVRADGSLNVTQSSFSDNSASRGGAIFGGPLTVTDSTFDTNTADSGGAIFGAPLTVIGSTFANNEAISSNGGAIYSPAGTLTITNSTFILNTAFNQGGAITTAPPSLGQISSSTFVNNEATGLGDSIAAQGSASVKNSILVAAGGNCTSNININGSSFSTDSSCIGATVVTSGDLNLGTLTDNGGPTQTIALGAGSVAIDAATDCTDFASDPISADQRGVTRPQGPECDAGAYEFNGSDTAQTGPTFEVNTTDVTDDGVCGTIHCTLVEAINAANAQVGANTIELGTSQTYTLTEVNHTGVFYGDRGLPSITTSITINGNGSTITRDTGAPEFGIFHVADTLMLVDMTLSNGDTNLTYDGGAIYNDSGSVSADNVLFENNKGGSGGAIRNGDGDITVSDSFFVGNQATGCCGGAIFNNFGILSVSRTTFRENTSIQVAGGIYNTGSSSVVTLNDVTFTDNTAETQGAAIGNAQGTMNVTNVTIAGNTTNGPDSGAIHITSGLSNTTNLSFVTVANNVGGGIYAGTSSYAVKNSIFASNGGDNCFGANTVEGVNFADDSTCSGFTQTAGLNLGTLTDNGGPTQTIALGAGSVAIDAATDCTDFASDPISADQRGVTRPQGPECDAGAYEFNGSDTAQTGPTFEVNTTDVTDDGVCGTIHCTLVEAINAANANADVSEITFDVPLPATITLSATLPTISTEMAINGLGSLQFAISGNDVARPFFVNASGILTLRFLAVRDGLATSLDGGGGLYNAGGQVFLENVLFFENATGAGQYGGAVFNQAGTLVVTGGAFTDNTATFGGGAIMNWQGDVTVNTATFTGNAANSGAALYNYSPDDAMATMTIATSTITDNTAGATPGNGGGGVASESTSGAATLNLVGVTIADNGGFNGGGVWINSGAASISRSTINNNAGGNGGGLMNSGTTVITNSTIVSNTSSSIGGNLYNEDTLTLNNSTIASGFAEVGNQIFNDPDATMTSRNTIVVRQAGGASCIAAGTFIVQGTNFATDPTCSGYTVVTPAQLNLSTLADNGGPTQTMALGTGSIALDTAANCTTVDGTAVTIDQRGVTRPQGAACDVGAFELTVSEGAQSGPIFIVNTTAMDNNGMCGTLHCTLVEAINVANAQAGANTIELGESEIYTLTQVNNTDFLIPIGLPIVSTPITINAHGATIRRDSGAPLFGIFGVDLNGDLVVNDGTVNGGHSTGGGGAFSSDGKLTLNNMIVSGNQADTGGGAITVGTELTVSNSTITNNSAQSAGAIRVDGATVMINNSTIGGNNALANGGGIDNLLGTVTITNSTINGNTAGGDGGGIHSSGFLVITNSTIANNTAVSGGGIYDTGGATISFVTIANNSGGGVYTDIVLNAMNSIITGHGSDLDCFGDVNDQGVNFSEDGQCTGFEEGTPAQLALQPLTNNGGPTQTVALGAGSIAIDAATDCTTFDSVPVTTDQRGITRPQGAECDAGAYEFNSSDTPQVGPDYEVNTLDDLNDGVCGTTHCSLREAVNAANAFPNPDVITFTIDTTNPILLTGGELTIGQPVTILAGTLASISGQNNSRIFNVTSGELTLTNIDLYAGATEGNGGAVSNSNLLTINGGNIYSNAAGQGGAIYNSGIATVNGSNIYSNQSGNAGGAIYNAGVMTVNDSTIQGNSTVTPEPTSRGGAIANVGSITINHSRFLTNRSLFGQGGAIHNEAELIVNGSTFEDHEAASGGAIYAGGEGSVVTLTNVTLSGNEAGEGGGIYIVSQTTLNFVTVANNTGGGIFSDGFTYAIKNSIVADQASGANCSGTAPGAQGANFTDDASCGLAGFTNTSTPLIEGLGFNGGYASTHALTENSPAREAATNCTTVAGVPVTTDARGVARPQGPQCDAGAFEFGGDLHVTTTQMIEDGADGKCSLPEAIIAANTGTASGSAPGECVPLASAPQIITLSAGQTYTLREAYEGRTGLPTINVNTYLYLNGATITRAADAPEFRIFHIGPSGSLYFTNAGIISGGRLNETDTGNDHGAAILNQGVLISAGVTFENNVAFANGGAIYNDAGASASLFSNMVRNNQARNGGAIYNAGGFVNSNSGYVNRFEDNTATMNGGAVYNAGGSVDLGYGAFIDNSAGDTGGAIYQSSGTFTGLNTTFSGNQAVNAGAIFLNSGNFELNFATVTRNTTTDNDSGAVAYNDGSMLINNSIVANNAENNCIGLEIGGSNNLQFPPGDCGAGFTEEDPLLGALAGVGFYVYHPLLIGSPAIDEASTVGCPALDARFSPRPVGVACDIGSFEGEGIALSGDLTVTTTAEVVDPFDGLCSLVEAIDAANSGAPSGSTAGECVPAGGPEPDVITLGAGQTYTLTVINNATGGENGLPVISTPVTIMGNGSTITRFTGVGAALFRFFLVEPDGDLTLNNLTLSRGFSGVGGGAILANGGLTLNSTSIRDNSASSGGGIIFGDDTVANINNSSITGNTAVSDDGAGMLVRGTLTVTNSTIAGNSANMNGGGIVTGAGSSASVTLIHTTIASNTANFGAGVAMFGGAASARNTIIANNLNTSNASDNCSSEIIDDGGNLQSDISCFNYFVEEKDPLLGPLTGSPAYLPLGTGSPAIDTASVEFCTSTDQRGVARPQGAGCDIGAVEASEAPALVPGSTGGAASLVQGGEIRDFVRFGDTTLSPLMESEWRGDNVALPDDPTDPNVTIGRDPVGGDTNHVTDWLRQRPTQGGQNAVRVLINEVYTGTNDLVELYNPTAETVNLSGWELILYDANDQIIPAAPGATYTVRFPNVTLLRPGQYLIVAEENPGAGSNFIDVGVDINWDDWNASGAVSLTNGLTGVDFVKFGGSSVNQLAVDPPPGTGFVGIVQPPLPGESIGRDTNSQDTNTPADWISQTRSAGENNEVAEPPANDEFEGATLIDAVPFRDTGDTMKASAVNDPALSCGISVGHTVWYKYVATNSTPVRFQTDGSDFDTVLAIFRVNASNQLVPVGCNQRGNALIGSRLTLNPTSGTTYLILLGGNLNTSGEFIFSVNAPVNDDIDAATSINMGALPFQTFGINGQGERVVNASTPNTTGASHLVNETVPTCAPNIGRSVWYRFTATDDTTLRLRTSGTDFDTVIAIYTGTRDNLAQVACNNDDASTTTSDLAFTPVAGTEYFVQVSGNGDQGGDLFFEVDAYPTPDNDFITDAFTVIPNDDPTQVGKFLVLVGDDQFNAPFAQDTTGATDLLVADDDDPLTDPVLDPVALPENVCGLSLGGSVWFSYTPTTEDTVVFQTFNSNYDTALAIWSVEVTEPSVDVSDPANLTFVACNDDAGVVEDPSIDPSDPFQRVNKNARIILSNTAEQKDAPIEVGRTYYIRVSGYFGETGDLVFNVFTPQTEPPANDRINAPFDIDFNAADGTYTVISPAGSDVVPFAQDTTGAFPELRIPDPAPDGWEFEPAFPTPSCGTDVGYTVWYRYAADERQQVVFDAAGSDFDTVIAAYVQQGANSWVEVGCNDDFEGRPQSLLSLNTNEGVVLYVMFGGFKKDRGNLQLGIAEVLPVVDTFTLVDAAEGTDIEDFNPIEDGAELDLSALPESLAIRANVIPEETGSVMFLLQRLEGEELTTVLESTDNSAPYALSGNNPNGSYLPTPLIPGTYTLTATPYTDVDGEVGEGRAGTALTIDFTVVEGDNLAPFIDVELGDVTVAEGLDAINNGTYGDQDGEAALVELTASVGVVTTSPAENIWSWSLATTDGPLDQVVTITATDSEGKTASVSFDLTVTNTNPTAQFSPIFVSQNVRRLTFTEPVDVAADLPGLLYSYDCSFDTDGDPGNDDFDVENVTATTFDCTFDTFGTYQVRGRIMDKDGGFTIYEATVVIQADNTPPTVNAGADQIITLPTNSVSLTGTASDDGLPMPPTLTVTWSAIENPPAPVVFDDASALSTTATFSASGVYTLELSVSDGLLTSRDTLTVVVNVAPQVDAGENQTITLPTNSVNLSGTAVDDGLPPGSVLTVTWTADNPPAPVVFGNANALSTTATFTIAGTYTLRLTVSDGVSFTSDTLTVTVNNPENQAPVVEAGANQIITLPTNSVNLNGTVTDDGFPLPPTLTVTWTAINNPPAPVTFGDANALSTTATFSAGGVYTLQLSAYDGERTTTDTLTVVVNQSPVVEAGANQTIMLPTNSVNLSGTATDDSLPPPPTLTVTWTAINNPPAPVTFGNANALSTTATFTLAGTYTLQLTASDGVSLGTDTLIVTVQPQPTGPTTVTEQVDLASDDVNEEGNAFDARNTHIWVGTAGSVSKSFLGVRFNNLEIPQGATITNAYVEFYSPGRTWIQLQVLIAADAVDDSQTFASNSRPSGRSLTTARVQHSSDVLWRPGTWNNLGDIKTVIQEIVSRPGWQAGNSLSIILKGNGAQWGRKFATSFDGDPAFAPRLVVTYTGAVTPNIPPDVNVDPGSANVIVNEGQPAAATGTVVDLDNNPVTLSASIGTVQKVGNAWSWSYTPPDNLPAPLTVTITATDSRNGTDTATFTLTVNNVAPAATFTAQPATTFPNTPVTLRFTNPVDVAADLPGLTYSFDCGNGSSAPASPASQFSCTYAGVGTFTALGTVTDKDGGSTTYQATVVIDETPAEPTTVMSQVNNTSDDVNEDGNNFTAANSQVWVGTAGNVNHSFLGVRFNNLNIPQGATITEAYVEVYAVSNHWIQMRILMAADAVDNSQTFASNSRPSGRTFTTNRVEYATNTLWSANTWNSLGDITTVVQEVVNRTGWQAGNSLSVIVKGAGPQWGRKFFNSYNGNAAFAPRLVVRYTLPSAVLVEEGPVDLIAPVPLNVAFTSDVTGGVAPASVQFINLTTGDMAGQTWDFGDGSTSTDMNPVHVYQAAGSYTVTLTVTGTDGTTGTAQTIIAVTDPLPTDTPVEVTPPPPTEEVTTPPPTETVPVEVTPPPTEQAPPEVLPPPTVETPPTESVAPAEAVELPAP